MGLDRFGKSHSALKEREGFLVPCHSLVMFSIIYRDRKPATHILKQLLAARLDLESSGLLLHVLSGYPLGMVELEEASEVPQKKVYQDHTEKF